jgi:aspartate/methionine/tyrosine aminotransferase
MRRQRTCSTKDQRRVRHFRDHRLAAAMPAAAMARVAVPAIFCDSPIMPLPNSLVADTASPPIPEAQAWARRYGGSHGPLLDLCQAVPGYPPHPDMLRHLAEAAGTVEAARYGPIAGDAALREAYAGQLRGIYGTRVAAEQVAITSGCNAAFFVAMIALARHGDAVLLPTPWYFNYQMTLAMLGVEPRPLPCRAEAGFVPDPDDAARLIDSRVRAVVLVTPNNPTGAVYPPDTIARFAELCAHRGIWLVLDETYRDFLPSGATRPHNVCAADWPAHVVQLYSFSKAYCIPGHRLGALTADPALITEIAKILDCVQICPQRAAQSAVLWALHALNEWRDANRAEINDRARALREAFAAIPSWRIESLGAYFAYVRHPFGRTAAPHVAERMAVERGALCLPGTCFGPEQEAHLRIAFANIGADGLHMLAQRLVGFTV